MTDVIDEAEFELCCEDEILAQTSGPRAEAYRQIMHHAAMCADEGDLELFEIVRKPIPLVPMNPDYCSDTPRIDKDGRPLRTVEQMKAAPPPSSECMTNRIGGDDE